MPEYQYIRHSKDNRKKLGMKPKDITRVNCAILINSILKAKKKSK